MSLDPSECLKEYFHWYKSEEGIHSHWLAGSREL
jgi:hypothetical protein